MRPTEVLADVLGRDSLIGVMCGPNLATEVVRHQPAATVLAFEDHSVAAWLRPQFAAERFDVYTNDDVVGCEVGGSVKNVVAVAAGMASELGHGQNAISALVCRGLVEMTRLGVALGARPETFLGLAGQGDLMATCLSEQSRNHRFGRELAKGRAVPEISADTNMVAEGVKSVDSLLQLAARYGVEMPLAAMVSAVVRGEHHPHHAFEARRRNEPAHELEGVVALPPSRTNPTPTPTPGETS
jgi:glycerol-3-phosphate dehydrogenase (NAD(P)+)